MISRNARFPARAFALAILVAAGTSSGCDAPEEAPLATPTSPQRIGPDGGLVTSEDGVMTLSIRPGALDRFHTIRIEPSDEPPPVFSQAYRVRPSLALGIGATVTFHHPLPDDLQDAAIGAVSRNTYEMGEGRWTALPTALVEPGRITAIDHELSVFYGVVDLARSDEQE